MDKVTLAIILITVIDIVLAVVAVYIYKDLKEHKNRYDTYVRLNEERHRLEKLRKSREQKQRQIFVFNPLYKKWELTDFERLHDGDLFKIIQNGVRYTDPSTGDNIWVADGQSYIGSSGYPEIKTYY